MIKLELEVINRNKYALAYLEASKDKNFLRLPENEQTRLISESITIGEDAASWASLEFGMDDPRDIAEKMGLKVLGEEKGITGKIIKYSEYRPQDRQIIVFRDALEKMIREVKEENLNKKLLRYLVAHELFHHLEAEKFGQVYKKFKLLLWKFGPFSKEIYIKRLSEVAAQAFAQKLLKLEMSSGVFDYLVNVLFTSNA